MERLRVYIRLRINSGEFTERSLARVLHVSQAHLHNMLKGVRNISMEFADQVMFKFSISVLDLMSNEEIWQFLDENSPDWITAATNRKPAARSSEREGDPRAPWREKRTGSKD